MIVNSDKHNGFELNLPKLEIGNIISLIKPKGHLAYEYNPLHNFRYASEENEAGEIPYVLTDFNTSKLNFSLNNPVEITCLPSYDGSVNLILNDDLNIPRLINTRFSTRENNTYEIVDRIGSNDTNIYDFEQFDLDTSLYKRINEIPSIEFLGLSYGGNLPVGNYNFYFKYSDSDGNETDFIGESSQVVCHMGNINDPHSMRGGLSDENSNKIVQFSISNIDSAYDYIMVYYTRLTSLGGLEPHTEAKKINKKFKIKGSLCFVTIDGFETTLDIPMNLINTRYFIANKAKTLAICQNRLFLANLNKPYLDFETFRDLSLRILPYYKESNAKTLIGELDYNYNEKVGDDSYGYEYYNALNIYNKVGYWNEEIYRLGIVYILNDDSLSPVFNIRGSNNIPKFNVESDRKPFYTNEADIEDLNKKISFDETTYQIGDGNNLENAMGVIRINSTSAESNLKIYSLCMKIPNVIVNKLKTLNVKGFFFVRQKRIPTILAQAFTMGHDRLSGIPLIRYNNEYLAESFVDKYVNLNAPYKDRLYHIDDKSNRASNECALCPEYELKQPFFNSMFTNTDFIVKSPNQLLTSIGLTRDTYLDRHYYNVEYMGSKDNQFSTVTIMGIGDSVSSKCDESNTFCSLVGDAENVTIFKLVGKENKIENYEYKPKNVFEKLIGDVKTYDNNIIRGAYGPFLGFSGYTGKANQILNIYIPGYTPGKMNNYFKIRYEDSSPFYAISNRFSLNRFKGEVELFRGDCYICNYTHRLNRNFLDLMTPNNDTIIDMYTWKNNYNLHKPENLNNINKGDINAVPLGSWITIKLRSNINLSLRDLNFDYNDEFSLSGVHRTFYPLTEISTEGNYKIPESNYINSGISSTSSQRYNFVLPNVPYLKNNYDNRIIYSDVSINDSFKNGFRVFRLDSYKDYPTTYGSIVKLIELDSNLLCVFEHGIGLLPIQERVLAGSGLGGNVFINQTRILPETMNIISDSFGSLWKDSVIKTPSGVYGVDTVAKKIWRVGAKGFEAISDFKVNKFLNDNITLTEREFKPVIGIRNVKSHYNANKKDVMFTFYDNLYGFEEKAWNLCYNEIMESFLTFYSWIPSFSENIDNVYYSFDRNTSKNIAKLGISNKNSNVGEGIVLDNNIINTDIKVDDITASKNPIKIATLTLKNRLLPDTNNTGIKYKIEYTLERDPFDNYKMFKIEGNELKFNNSNSNTIKIENNPVTLLNIKAFIVVGKDLSAGEKPFVDTSLDRYKKDFDNYYNTNYTYYQSQVAVTAYKTISNISDISKTNLTTDFWKHGKAGIIDIKDDLKPCFWYGKLHPFEFEFIVNTSIDTHKIFDDLLIISNNAEPESFHYEITGDCFDFAKDKKNMYIRQEFTKDLLQNNGSSILYNRNAFKLNPELNTKSTLFPLYYARYNDFNFIEDHYAEMTSPNKDYSNLSGTEVIYDENLNEFKISNHVKAVDIKDLNLGRLRGNMDYLEDKWRVQINPINFILKNELPYGTKIPIALTKSLIPNDLVNTTITDADFPKDLSNLGYNTLDINVNWDVPNGRKEVKLKDKYIKIKIRYKGNKKAIIAGVRTLFRMV